MNPPRGAASGGSPAKLDSSSRTAEIDLAFGVVFDGETELGADARDDRSGLPAGEKLHEIKGMPAVVQEDTTAGFRAIETPAGLARPSWRVRPRHLPID